MSPGAGPPPYQPAGVEVGRRNQRAGAVQAEHGERRVDVDARHAYPRGWTVWRGRGGHRRAAVGAAGVPAAPTGGGGPVVASPTPVPTARQTAAPAATSAASGARRSRCRRIDGSGPGAHQVVRRRRRQSSRAHRAGRRGQTAGHQGVRAEPGPGGATGAGVHPAGRDDGAALGVAAQLGGEPALFLVEHQQRVDRAAGEPHLGVGARPAGAGEPQPPAARLDLLVVGGGGELHAVGDHRTVGGGHVEHRGPHRRLHDPHLGAARRWER